MAVISLPRPSFQGHDLLDQVLFPEEKRLDFVPVAVLFPEGRLGLDLLQFELLTAFLQGAQTVEGLLRGRRIPLLDKDLGELPGGEGSISFCNLWKMRPLSFLK